MDVADGLSASFEKHVCISDHRAIVRERVGDMIFEYPGGSFFQNNNSVLVPLTDYVREAIFLSTPTSTSERPTHLVDAYCGAGLFAITLSPYFDTIAGIELSSDSIKFATRNAQLNNIPDGKCTFRAGDAANIFAAVPEFSPQRTALIIDPPRKGCDENFIDQLLTFKAQTVVYVSCNVHTQARDVGMILKRSEKQAEQNGGRKYVLESLRGFDLFPQTAHVESVAVLRLLRPAD
jgi:tRNA (uracil-5-)-methyltransferase